MSAFQHFSIKHKLTWIIMVTSSIALVFASTAFMMYDRYSFKGRMVRDLEIVAEIIGAHSAAALVFNDRDDAVETLQASRAEPNIVAVAIYRADGTLFAAYNPGEVDLTSPDVGPEGYRFEDEHMDFARPIVLDQERVGTVFIRTGLGDLRNREVRYALIVAAVLIGSTLVVFLITARLQRLISGPILRLADSARAVSDRSDYSHRVYNDSDDEVGFLIERFNDMMAQIQERDAALQKVNEELETRVAVRTRDLASANAQLRSEIDGRRRTEAVLEERDEQLRQSQKMDAIGRLAGGVSHDFNNQLAIIRGYVDMALDDIPRESPSHAHLQQVSKAVMRSAGLTEQLLIFSSKQQVSMRPMDLNRAVDDLRKMLGRLLGEDIQMVVDLEENVWAVNADAGNMDQVITNLCLNARDATPGGGTLTVRTRTVVVDEAFCRQQADARPGLYLCLSVTDTGTGMTEEVRSRVFEPFFTTKAPGKGTGLGLSVVYGIVQAHEGWITVESKLNQGSRFSVYLPAIDQEAEAPGGVGQETPLEALRGKGEQVLLVEDEQELCQMTARALSDNGYVVQACATVSEACRLFEQADPPIELVLSDVGLPDGRGTDLVFGFLTERPGISAILVTGYADERGDWARAEQAGLMLLQKPVPIATLLGHIHETLREGRNA